MQYSRFKTKPYARKITPEPYSRLSLHMLVVLSIVSFQINESMPYAYTRFVRVCVGNDIMPLVIVTHGRNRGDSQ